MSIDIYSKIDVDIDAGFYTDFGIAGFEFAYGTANKDAIKKQPRISIK